MVNSINILIINNTKMTLRGNIMVNDNLEEKRKHGDFLLPLGIYDVNLGNDEFSISAHWHKEIEIILIKSGEFNLQINSDFYTCKSGDIIIINCEELHYLIAKENVYSEFISLVFDISQLNSSILDSSSVNFITPILNKKFKLPVIIDTDCSIYNDLKEIIMKIIKVYNNRYYGFELEIKALMFSFFANIFRENLVLKKDNTLLDDSKALKIKKVIKYIEGNYQNDINISDLSNLCHYNEYHFMRFFKKYTGKTCIQFIKNYRLEKAYILLRNTDLSITQISFEVGFSNVSYFIRSFKEKYKVAPREFRLKSNNSFEI